MTETIQKLPTATVTADECRTAVTTGDGVAAARRAFLEHAAEFYDTRLTPAQLDIAAALDDAAALASAFPWLSDAERSEALWAFGHGSW